MRFNRLFPRVWSTLTLVAIAALTPATCVGWRAVSVAYRDRAAHDMLDGANLAACFPWADFTTPMTDEERAARMLAASRAARARLSLFAPDGRLIADTLPEGLVVPDARERSEVREALAGRGTAIMRTSVVFGDLWMFAAVPTPGGGALRMGECQERIHADLARGRRNLLFGALGALLFVTLFGWYVARRLAKPLETFTRDIQRYARGEFSVRANKPGYLGEMASVAAAFDAMAEELEERFRTIRRQRHELAILLEALGEGVLSVSADSVYAVNRCAREMLDLPADGDGLFPPATATPVPRATLENIPALAGFIRAVRERRAPRASELLVRRGEDRIWDVQTTPLDGPEDSIEGMHTLAVVVLRDITRLRQLEIVRRDFVANVSHELRTPAAVIQGYLETVLDEDACARPDPATVERFLGVALEAARRLNAIVADLLILSTVENGRHFPAAEEPLEPLLEEAARQCQNLLDARRARVAVFCDPDLSAPVNARLFERAMGNLIENAAKFGPEGGEVRVKAVRTANGGVDIRVEDDGPGIAAEHVPRLFERFYRVEPHGDGGASAEPAAPGIGIGLSVVVQIARAHGARIQVESEPGKGSAFTWRQER